MLQCRQVYPSGVVCLGTKRAVRFKPMIVSMVAGSLWTLPAIALAQDVTGEDKTEKTQLAQTVAQVSGPLPDVVVTATRQEERIDAVPSTVTTIDSKQIERTQPRDETDLFANEPDMATSRDRRRFGVGSVNIRGIEDNRVLQTVDGVRLPDYYNRGGPSNIATSTRDAPEFSFLKRVEVLRGPASSLYGADAIGGVVAYLTKDPEDLLKGKTWAAEYSAGWDGADNGVSNYLGLAAGNDMLKGLVMLNNRYGTQMSNMGNDTSTSVSRTAPNPQDYNTNALLAKLVFQPVKEHSFKLTYEVQGTETDTDVLRLSSAIPRVTTMTGSDTTRRNRYGLDYEWKPAKNDWIDRVTASAYHQFSVNDTHTYQRRSNTTSSCSASTKGAFQCDALLDFNFQQQQTGLSLQGDKSFETGPLVHSLIAGADYLYTKTQEARDATTFNLNTGVVSQSIAGENYPIHDFPKGHTTQTGVFVQDQIMWGNVTITPGLRYDSYQLKPDSDALFDAAAVKPAVSKSDSALSPKLAALWQITPEANVYGQYVFGFRAPSYEEVNGSFRNTVQGYGSSPNPDLKAEKSQGVEIGARYIAKTYQASVAVYDNRYRDFIEQVVLNCPSDPACISGLRSTYQYRNQSKVRIYGIELRGAWMFLDHWRIDGALAWAHGENQETDEPLNSVSPLNGNLGVSWLRDEQGTQGASLRMRASKGVTRVDDSSFDYFKPAGYAVMDFQVWWTFTKYARASFAVNNIFDHKYWLWGDVRSTGVAANEPGLDFYTQPGRNVTASITLSF